MNLNAAYPILTDVDKGYILAVMQIDAPKLGYEMLPFIHMDRVLERLGNHVSYIAAPSDQLINLINKCLAVAWEQTSTPCGGKYNPDGVWYEFTRPELVKQYNRQLHEIRQKQCGRPFRQRVYLG